MISSDQQHTWYPYIMTNTNSLIQPSVIRPDIGQLNLLAFLRDKRSEFIYTSTSADDGEMSCDIM